MAKRISRKGKFDFVGEFVQVANESKGHRDINGKNNFVGQRLSFGVIDKDNSRAYVELFGGITAGQNELKVFEDNAFEFGKSNRISIPMANRHDKNILAMVADFNKTVVDFTEDSETQKEIGSLIGKLYSLSRKTDATEEERKEYKEYKKQLLNIETRKEFITKPDAIKHIFANLDYLEGKTVRVRGDVTYNCYKGKINPVYAVTSLELSNKPKEQHELSLKIYPVFDEDSIDSSELKENGRVYVHGYAESYSSDTRSDMLFPQTFSIDTREFDLTTKEGLANLKLFLGLFKIDPSEQGFLYQLGWEAKVTSQLQQAEVSEEDDKTATLTDMQKQMVEIGVLSLEDVLPKTRAFNQFETEILLTKPIITRDFKDGKLSAGISQEDAEEHIIRPGKDIKVEEKKTPDVKEEVKKEEKPVITESVEDVMSDIFG